MGFHANQTVVSCEHATNRLPTRYGTLGLSARDLRSHVALDIGAAGLSRSLASFLCCPLFLGSYSRLLVDLNRSPRSRSLIVHSNHGYAIPGNRGVDARERSLRIERYHRPYQESVAAAVSRIIRRRGACLHLSVHSFTPSIDGLNHRNCDIGLLYHPRRKQERSFAEHLRAALSSSEYRVRMNFPYRGTMDGLQTQMKRTLGDRSYVGLEIETSQRLFTSTASARRLAAALRAALGEVLAGTP